ncbi:WAS/WASL-interacting protein family member 1-like [Phocoena phocoena]|uniref:WAS/WASL-interacting protein family member 1-like n=1 Tax=Phocoena phocoena TaxID=9742 RepID=UPI0033077AA9
MASQTLRRPVLPVKKTSFPLSPEPRCSRNLQHWAPSSWPHRPRDTPPVTTATGEEPPARLGRDPRPPSFRQRPTPRSFRAGAAASPAPGPTPPHSDPPPPPGPPERRSRGEGEEAGEVCERERGRTSRRRFVLPGSGGGVPPGPRTSAGRAGGAEEAGGKPGAANWGGGALPPLPPSVRALAAWPHLPGGLGATSRRRGPVPGAGGAWRCGREARASARRPGLRGQVMVGPCASPEERGPPEQLCPQAAPASRLDISRREVGQL